MSHPNKAKGTRFESEVVEFLADDYPAAERRGLHGANDRGDVINVPNWTLEAKNEKAISLATYMKELEAEIANAGTEYGAAIVKRRGKNVREAYAVMPLWRLLAIMRALQ